VLLAAKGGSTRSIAEEVGVQPRIVSNWRRRFGAFAWTKKKVYQRRFKNRRITQL